MTTVARITDYRRTQRGEGDLRPVRESASESRQMASDVQCRPIRFRDLPPLLGNYIHEQFDRPESDVLNRGAVQTSLTSLLRLSRRQPRTFVAAQDGNLAAYVQFRQGYRDRRWIALGAGYASRLNDPSGAVEAVIAHAVTAAGARGHKRLYARVPNEAELVPCFVRLGFQRYASETVFVAGDLSLSARRDVALIEQDASHTWAVHQLYNATSPKDVQYAEALTSHHWELGSLGRRAGAVRGYLVEQGYQVASYARVFSLGGRHTVEMIYTEEVGSSLPDIFNAVLAKTAAISPLEQVYVTARSYQFDLIRTLEGAGFLPLLQQAPMVKYTAARVHNFTPQAGVQLQAELRDRVPKHVPTFLRRHPQPEA